MHIFTLEPTRSCSVASILLFIAFVVGCGGTGEAPDDLAGYAFDTIQFQIPDTGPALQPGEIACQADLDCSSEFPLCDLTRGICVECLNLDNCAENEECLEGACVPSGSICVPDKFRCLGKVVQQCASDGLSFLEVQVCEFGCANAQCTQCQPAQTVCNGVVVDKCELDGSGWVIAEDCAAVGQTCLHGKCVDLCSTDVKLNTNVGCEYWAVDLDNHVEAQDSPFAVIVSNLSVMDATVTITRMLGEGMSEEAVDQKVVAAGALEIFSLPPFSPSGAGISWSSYHVSSTAPIIAYQFNPLENVDVFSNDASMLIPENSFGKEYIVQSRDELLGGITIPPGETCASYCTALPGGQCSVFSDCQLPYRGTVTVVAKQANTQVTVKSTATTLAGPGFNALSANSEQTVTLQPYQVLNIKTNREGDDLTGTIITSSSPVAVFGGHEAAVTSTECCADHLEQQLFPVSTWGKEYIAAKSFPRGAEKDYWRIVGSEDGTNVSFSPAVSSATTLNRGEWVEISTDQDFVITATKPISVAQILASSLEILTVPMGTPCVSASECHPGHTCEFSASSFSNACLPPTCTNAGTTIGCPAGHSCACYEDALFPECRCSPTGDPALILVPPAEQFRDQYVFLTPNKYANDYVNVIAPNDAVVTLDNIQIPDVSFVPISGSNYKVTRMGVLDGTHTITSTAPVGVVVYGYDKDVSYGYVAGLNLTEL